MTADELAQILKIAREDGHREGLIYAAEWLCDDAREARIAGDDAHAQILEDWGNRFRGGACMTHRGGVVRDVPAVTLQLRGPGL